MQRTKIVPKTKIEMGDRAWNVFKGKCPYACWYCWARNIKQRFKEEDPLRWNEERFRYRFPKEPCRILVCWTIDLMHPTIDEIAIELILTRCRENPQHTFLFLTKNPVRYAEFDFPKNCWLGTTITTEKEEGKAEDLRKVKNIKFVSYEPLLGVIRYFPTWIDWVIIGALTGSSAKKHRPHPYWIGVMVDACRNHSIPVFLKDNLASIWGKELIQEFPQEQKEEIGI